MPSRDYIFYELTNSICSTCFDKVEAKILFENGHVYMVKNCLVHGREKILISTDVDYYKKCRDFNKPGDMPQKFQTHTKYGCPYDCGLCPDHEQHSCLTLVEVTDRCNLSCPTCYASSGPKQGKHRSLEEITFMLDQVVASELEPDVVQISGGEPTIHPDFFKILDLAKERPIRHLMVNTNGIRIAQDKAFAERLASYAPGFEVYLQFDSFRPEVFHSLRGSDLRKTREQALQHLNEFNLSTNLVVTLQNGLNTDEIGDIIEYALQQPCVRGVTFQPTQVAGRLSNFDPAKDRITLGEVRQLILEQCPRFTPDDVVPVPCHPDALAMAYCLKLGGEVIPLTRYFTPEDYLSTAKNTINFENLPGIKEKVTRLFSTGESVESVTQELQAIMCCLPQIDLPELKYENLFRVIIMQFYDRYNFDVRGVKKSCVHICHPDGRIIPFDTMNLFYRDSKVEKTLKERRSRRIPDQKWRFEVLGNG